MVRWLLALLPALLLAAPCQAQPDARLNQAADAVVGVTARIPAGARTARFLGTERQGNGVVIDDKGLIVTIGYVVLEADKIEVTGRDGKTVPATFVGYDAGSGLGLVRAMAPLPVKPLPIGASEKVKREDAVILVQFAAETPVTSGIIVSRRNFAGYWEYLLENAIFAVPPIANFAGAALLNTDFELVGIGSLFVGDAAGHQINLPGNMFVPADRVFPVMADLIANGRPSGPAKPWLGVNVNEAFDRVFVTRLTPGGPAEVAGVAVGDIILAVGGQSVSGMEDLYRNLWGVGRAGVEVPVKVLHGPDIVERKIRTRDRYSNYRLEKFQ